LRLSLNRAAQLVMPVAVGGAIGAAGYGFGFGLTGVVLAGLAAAALRVRAFETYSPSGLWGLLRSPTSSRGPSGGSEP